MSNQYLTDTNGRQYLVDGIVNEWHCNKCNSDGRYEERVYLIGNLGLKSTKAFEVCKCGEKEIE